MLRAKVDSQVSTLGRIVDELFADNPGALTALGRREPGPRTPPPPEGQPPHASRPSQAQYAVLGRAHRLYEGALGDASFITALNGVGYSKQRLTDELADVTALEAADIEQEQEKAETAGGHAAEQQARTALKAWLKRYKNFVTADLKDQPIWLMELTLKPRGRPKSK